MNLFKSYSKQLHDLLDRLMQEGQLPSGLDLSRVTVQPPRDAKLAEMSSNAAMVLAKPAGMKPRDLAALLSEHLAADPAIRDLAVAGPGFINWSLAPEVWRGQVSEILRAGRAYGDSDLGGGEAVNVEYVSANPTGPLTVGHARGAVVGDALAGLLEKAGFAVTREYYINDAGGQVDTLARSTYLRYREALGLGEAEIPEGLYPGAYLLEVGQALAARDGDRWLEADEADWLGPIRAFAIAHLMAEVKTDLAALGIHQEVFTSERSLVEAGAVGAVEESLQARGLLYIGTLEPPKGKTPEDWEPRPQTLFKATRFGDDIDRPLRKSDGSWTYFANDMAYHLDKYRRGFKRQIDVWGADHGGYVKRMRAAVTALSDGEANLEVKLCQLVKLTRGGQPMRMSKRSGSFVTLRDLVEEVGPGVVRFIMLTRRNDAQLDFDLDKATEQSRDNPVFYVQYAHARAHSVLRHAGESFPAIPQDAEALAALSLDGLTDSGELALIRTLADWPRQVESAAEAEEPHRIAFYLYDVAAHFHGLWTRGKDEAELRFLLPDQPELTAARVALVRAMATVLASGLQVFGVEPLEELR
ncbi:MAG: arginine--tRNA ligase [Rhodospirillales bacterium]